MPPVLRGGAKGLGPAMMLWDLIMEFGGFRDEENREAIREWHRSNGRPDWALGA